MDYYTVLGFIGICAVVLGLLLFFCANDTRAQEREKLSARPGEEGERLKGHLGWWFGAIRRSLDDAHNPTRLMLVCCAVALSVPLIFIRQATWSWTPQAQLWFAVAAATIGAWWIVRHPAIARAVLPRHQTAYSLAWIRVVVCLGLLVLATRVRFADIALLPVELIRFDTLVSPLVDLLWNPADLRNPQILGAIQWVTVGSLLGAAFGLGGKPVMFLAAGAYTVFYHVQITYTHFYHSGLIPLQILYALCFMPTHRALALDTVIARRVFGDRPPPAPMTSDATYGWCVYLCWAIYGVSYFATGLSKFWVNPFWAANGNVLGMSLSDSLHIIEYDFNLSAKLVQWGIADALFPSLGVGAMVIEWAGVLILISGLARLVLPWLIGSLHLGIWFCHDFLFYELAVMPLIFLPQIWAMAKAPLPAAQPQRESPRWMRNGAAALVSGIITLIMAGWLYSRDSFPLLSYWGMYAVPSHRPLEQVHYSTLFKVRASGSRERTELIEYFSVLNHARWLDHVAFTSDRAQLRRMKALFDKVFELESGSPDPVVRFDVESNSWNVRTHPQDPNFGAPTGRLSFHRDGTVVEEKIPGAL